MVEEEREIEVIRLRKLILKDFCGVLSRVASAHDADIELISEAASRVAGNMFAFNEAVEEFIASAKQGDNKHVAINKLDNILFGDIT